MTQHAARPRPLAPTPESLRRAVLDEMPPDLRRRYCRLSGYNKRLLPNARLAEMEDGAVQPAQWYEGSGYSIGYPAWGLLYYLTMCRLLGTEGSLVIETGTNVGASTIVLGQAVVDAGDVGVVRTVDINPDHIAVAKENIELAGLSGVVEFHTGDALELLPTMVGEDGPISLAFMDGCHDAPHVEREFAALHEFLADDSIVVFDNSLPRRGEEDHPQVNTALANIVERFGGSLVCLPNCSWGPPGLSVWQRHAFSTVPGWPAAPGWGARQG
jgi:predicted O-methyltransferase YrrM